MAMVKAAEINKQLGRKNTARVAVYMAAHLGATNKECAEALGMNVCVIGRHVAKLRKQWKELEANG